MESSNAELQAYLYPLKGRLSYRGPLVFQKIVPFIRVQFMRMIAAQILTQTPGHAQLGLVAQAGRGEKKVILEHGGVSRFVLWI